MFSKDFNYGYDESRIPSHASELSKRIGNELDSVLSVMEDNFPDIRSDSLFSDDELRQEIAAYHAVGMILHYWHDIAPYVSDEQWTD